MILEHNQSFISISYTNISFLILKDSVETAFSCTDKDIFEEESVKKIKFLNHNVSCVDFDSYADSLGQIITPVNVKNCIILKKSENVKNTNEDTNEGKYIALISGTDCKVKKIKLKDFSVFPEFVNDSLQKKGILACYFDGKEGIGYLLDIETFLKYLELKK